MKIITILGTRPEIIRLSLIIGKLDKNSNHVLVHTGQNFTESLNTIFFDQLKVRKPDYFLNARGATIGEQISQIIERTEKVLVKEKPDALLILGDTNSGLSCIPAKRLHIPVYHMEAGNRCYNDKVPEEINRRIIDHSSDFLMPYTQRSKENLVREGIDRNKIFVTGNPINEVILRFKKQIDTNTILNKLKIKKDKYFLITMHRAENVDNNTNLKSLVNALEKLHSIYGYPIICSLHPRTADKMKKFNISITNKDIRFLTPMGFFEFIKLEQNAFCVLSDSGTVQEECSILMVPNVTMRDVTERPETLECGSNILSGLTVADIIQSVKLVANLKSKWSAPEEYKEKNVSDKVLRIIFSRFDF
ncbi:MAG: UDP-N-acetylglucosamine 2-epimerase (non-hydrolyzing) [Elusimicrobia bacterium]|nr:UDP-N-acetylglucosamine 2-epimerase (non-hydrolyzing) [Elusimicrobiota bacterium]